VRRLTSVLIQTSTFLLTCFLPLANAQSSNPNINRWARTADMTVARDQACAAVLSDGRLLVAGGMGAAGPLSTVDIYATDGTFTAGPPMSQARAQAACVALRDGTVLVTGGEGGSGALNTAEIFDPVANTWKATGNLAVAREGHQAAVTIGGNVWIAGGTNTGGMVGAIETYGAGKFRAVGNLNTPRTDFAMSPAGERNLVVAGGSDGTNTLASVELYDGLLQTLTIAGNMSQARKNFAAAPLLDGTVLVTGGLDSDGNLLSTTEIFDPVAGTSTAGPALAAARANHVAYALPGNGSVLIFGGTGFSTVLNSTEIFTPWTGKIVAASPLSAPRRNEAKANLRPGSFLIAGGRDDNGSLSSSELYQFATIGTDKSDYAPGTPVKISGGGWTPGEQVLVAIAALPLSQNHVEFTGTATADGSGNIAVDGFAVDQSHLGMKFLMTATGSKSEAQTAFTDAFTPIVTLAFSPANQPPGATVTATITVSPDQAGHPVPTGEVQLCDGTSGGGNGTCPTSYLNTPCTSGFTSDFCALTAGASSGTAQMPITLPAGNTTFGVIYFPDVQSQGTYTFVNATQDFTTYTALSTTTISMTGGPAGNTPYGSQFGYVATVTVTGGGTATGTVTFCETTGGTCTSTGPNIIGTVTLTNASNNVASLVPTTPLSIGSHTISASYAGDNSDAASTAGNSIVTNIQAVNTSTSYTLTPSGGTATVPPVTIVFSQPVSGTATVVAQAGGGTPTGTVQFAVDGSNVGIGNTLTGGSTGAITLSSSLAVGNHTVSAAYTPTGGTGWNSSAGNNGNATAIVVNQATTTVGTSLTSGAGTGTPTFTVTMTGTAPATVNPTTGTVTLYDGTPGNTSLSTVLGTGTLTATNSVQITSSVTLTSGTNPHTIWAAYAGNVNFAAGSSTGQTYNVTAPTATTVQQPTGPATLAYGQSVSYTGTVTASSGSSNPGGAANSGNKLTFCLALAATPATCVLTPAPSVQVTSSVAGPTVGQASFTIAAGNTQVTPGSYVLTTTYTNADGGYANSGPSTGLNITVTKAGAPFTITSTVSSGQNLNVTQPVTVTATYTGTLTPNPTGSVTFVNTAQAGATICGPATFSSGVASCTATAGPGGAAGIQVGAVTMSLSYAGDANYSLGTVTPESITVTKDAVSVTITATSADSPSPTQMGRTVTLTATATASTISVSPAGTTPTQANISITPPTTNVSNSTCATPTAGATTTNSATVSCTFQLTGNLPAPPSLNFTSNYSGDAYTLTGSRTNSMTVAGGATTTTITSITDVGGDLLSAVLVGRVVTINAQTVTGSGVLTQPTGSFTFNFAPGAVAVNATSNPGACGNLTNGATSATVTTTNSSVNATNGVATASCTFIVTGPPGANSYTVKYNGDTNTLTSQTAAASTITTLADSTTSTVTSITNVGGDPNSGVQIGRVVTVNAQVATASNVFTKPAGSFTFNFAPGSVSVNTTTNPGACGTLANGATSASVTTTTPSLTATNGVATASCTFILTGPIGTDSYSVTYVPDASTLTSTSTVSASTQITAVKANTTTTITSVTNAGGDPNSAVQIGRTVTINAQAVTGSNVLTQPTGSFTFNFAPGSVNTANGLCGNLTNGGTSATVTATNSSVGATNGTAAASCSFTLTGPAGADSYSVTYNGDANTVTSQTATPSTITAVAANTTTTFLSITNNGGDPNSAVQITRAVTLVAQAATGSGVYTLPTGSFTFNFAPGSVAPTGNPADCGALIQGATSVTITTTTPGFNGTSNGTASARCTFILTPPAGADSYTVTYNDDANTASSTSAASTITAVGAITTTTIPSITNVGGDPLTAVQIGRVVTINAQTVTNTGMLVQPTGSFTFNFAPGSVAVNNTANPGACGNLASGGTSATVTTTTSSVNATNGIATASCTFIVTQPAGVNSYTVKYNGDSSTANSTSSASTITTVKASTTTTEATPVVLGGDALTAVQNGRHVTVTATVTTGGSVYASPNGTFTFTFSQPVVVPSPLGGPSTCGILANNSTTGTVNGSASVNTALGGNGSATASCTFLTIASPGTLTVSATYNADNNAAGSTTATPQSMTLIPAVTTTTLAVPVNNNGDPNTAVQYGRVVTLTASMSIPVNDVAPINGSFTFTLPANSALPTSASSCGTLVNNGTTATVTNFGVLSGPGPQTVASATCTFILVGPTPIGPGAYNVAYNGDNINTASSTSQGSSTTQTITPALAATSLSAACTFGTGSVCGTDAISALVFGQPFTLTATLGSTTTLPADGAAFQASKSVAFTGPNGINYVVPIAPTNGVGGANVAGTATITSPGGVPFAPPPGAYTLNVSYPTATADPYYGASTGQVSFVINKAPVTVVVTPLPVSLAGVPNLQVTVAFAGNAAAGVPSGIVTVMNGGTIAATAPLGVTSTNCPQGRAPCGSALFALPSGTYSATYSGDSNFLSGVSGSSTPTTGVSASSSVTLTASPNPAQPGQQITITAIVGGSNGNGNPTGTVSFTDNGTLIGVAPVIGGVATLTVTLAPGSHVVSGSYSGDATYPASGNNLNISVTKPNANTTFSSNVTASVFGQGVTLTVRFTGPTTGGTLPTGTVQFLDNGQPIGSPVTITNGVATLTLASLPPGANNIGVQYSGDGSFANLTKNVGTVTVTQAQVTTTLTSTTNGSQMTLTATIAVVAPGAGTLTGTVQFIDTLTGAVLGTAPVNNGVAALTITATGDPIKAVYSGDTNFSTSQSPASATIALSDAASYAQTYAAGEIVTVFGSGLTTQTLSASLPLPVTLGGITVTVTDSAGVPRQAALFYVSPTQMSFLIPPGTATGTATVVVTTSAGSLTTTITIVGSTAALFTANANGSGPLAAQVVTVTPNGQQTYANTAVLSGTTFVNAPISLGGISQSPSSNQYVLLLYGTGFDNGKTVTVTINGQTFTPTYFGPQGTYAGLDQINVLLPASLTGAGQVNVSITVDGQTSNAGTIAFAAAGTN
jgi:hypothetical protein